MRNLTEIEYYITTTYRSIREKDPVYGRVKLLHPFRAALTNTAATLALPTTTAPEDVLAGVEQELKLVSTWVHTPQEYKEQIRARYQEIVEFIEGNEQA